MDAAPSTVDKARLLAADFATRAGAHDRDASFPFENFRQLFDAGLLSLTVPREEGGLGAGMLETTRVLNEVAKGCASTALVLGMHYIQHHSMARGDRWPKHLVQRLAKESLSGVSLINVLRVEAELGTPSRGGNMATVARRTAEGWRLSGRKIYSTGLPILKWYSVWARTEGESEPRLGTFLVPAGLAGSKMAETWDHSGMRATGSHDLILEDVLIPLANEIDVRPQSGWAGGDPVALIVHGAFVSAIYDGVARAARDWLVHFLHNRKPSNLGAALATLPRAQEVLGGIEVKLTVNRRMLETFAAEYDAGRSMSVTEANALKFTLTNNAVAAVEEALTLTGNHGLSRTNPLERHLRDVLCGRVHNPQDDTIKVMAGRLALGL
jgi:alkylation response protein AidB-like acyl-CoA dehydrogenase